MTSAPAAMYARWMARTRSGFEKFSSGSERSSETPPAWSRVPIAPSHTSTWEARRLATSGLAGRDRAVRIVADANTILRVVPTNKLGGPMVEHLSGDELSLQSGATSRSGTQFGRGPSLCGSHERSVRNFVVAVGCHRHRSDGSL